MEMQIRRETQPLANQRIIILLTINITFLSLIFSLGETSELFESKLKRGSGGNMIIRESRNTPTAISPTGNPIKHHWIKDRFTLFFDKRSSSKIFAGVPAGDINPPIPAHAGIAIIKHFPRLLFPGLCLLLLSIGRRILLNRAHVAKLDMKAEQTDIMKPMHNTKRLGLPDVLEMIYLVID